MMITSERSRPPEGHVQPAAEQQAVLPGTERVPALFATTPVERQPDISLPLDAERPTTTTHRCVGSADNNITCHFSSLVYDSKHHEFLYYMPRTPSHSIEEVTRLRFFEGSVHIRPMHRSARPPFPARRTGSCDELEPSYLYNMLVPGSFAHMSRDTLVLITANLHDLGLGGVPHRVVVLRSLRGNNALAYRTGGMRLLQRYVQWAGDGATWLHDVATACEHRYVVFRDIVFGTLLFNVHPPFAPQAPTIDRWGGCGSKYIQLQRDSAYALAGLHDVPPVHQHRRIKVLFHDKLASDQRRIINIPEMVAALRRRFPHVYVDSKVVSLLTPREQLVELSSSSIFISPHGSSSWRMLYLPTGAHAIIVGAGENDGYTLWHAHSELHQCWDKVGYLNVHRYHITDPDEVEDTKNIVVPSTEDEKEYRWWRTDKRLKFSKLADLVSASISAIAAVSNSSVSGAGTTQRKLL